MTLPIRIVGHVTAVSCKVRAALTGAHPRIGQEVLELLVLERRVTVDDVRGAMGQYRLRGGG